MSEGPSTKGQTIASRYGLPEFSELKTSTRTIMVYSNMTFDLKTIFENIPITHVEVPLTKKKKYAEKKKLRAPKGAIVSTQRSNFIRGIDLRKAKKHWCTECQKKEKKGNREVKVNTIVEELVELDNDTREIRYYCTECERYYELRNLRKITSFLNQITIVISLGDINLNVMMFKDNFKMAGCKNDEDAIEAMRILWENVIRDIPNAFTFKEGETVPRFAFRLVMRNVDFKLGFYIDRKKLNSLMNDKKYSDKVFLSQCETTGHTNVNIKMYSHRPKTHMFKCMTYTSKAAPDFEYLQDIPFKTNKPKPEKHNTFIVFGSSETILSGRYGENMKEAYEFFIDVVMSNKDMIEEKLVRPDTNLIKHLQV